MKLDVKTMLVTLGVCMLFAFTATEVLTVKPTMPKSVLAVECRPSSAVSIIKSYTKQGYVIKSYTVGIQYGSDGLLIMEKY